MSRWKRWLIAAVRWSLLVDAILAALLALLTVFKCPVWLPWPVGLVVTEGAMWFALLPLGFGVVAWFLRRGHRVVAAVTIGLCAVAILLLLKPTVQAWRLGRTLPGQLSAAFGPAVPQRAPFSLAAAVGGRKPEEVPVETMAYSGPLLLDFYRAV